MNKKVYNNKSFLILKNGYLTCVDMFCETLTEQFVNTFKLLSYVAEVMKPNHVTISNHQGYRQFFVSSENGSTVRVEQHTLDPIRCEAYIMHKGQEFSNWKSGSYMTPNEMFAALTNIYENNSH